VPVDGAETEPDVETLAARPTRVLVIVDPAHWKLLASRVVPTIPFPFQLTSSLIESGRPPPPPPPARAAKPLAPVDPATAPSHGVVNVVCSAALWRSLLTVKSDAGMLKQPDPLMESVEI
jgi:hypothetical protein